MPVIDMVLSMMYANEECRVCGKELTAEDMKTAVFAGYSNKSRARGAHKECWDGLVDVVGSMPQSFLDEIRIRSRL